MKLIRKIKELFNSRTQTKSAARQPLSDNENLQKVMHMLANTLEVEMSCDEVFAVLDQFAELVARGEDVSQAMSLVKQHLSMCPDCREEYEALERILQNAV